jgi:excisionase family DNA binding protein
MEKLLTIPEVATKVNVKPRTVRSWIEKRKITFVKLPGGDIRIPKEWLDGWLAARTVKAQISVKVN